MLFLPVAGFLFHEPALGDPARLSFEALVSTRVAQEASAAPSLRDASSALRMSTYLKGAGS
jgi:hypothetical protein